MAAFVYIVHRSVGRAGQGTKLDADSGNWSLKLHDQNFHVLSVAEHRRPAFLYCRLSGWALPNCSRWVVFSRQFATMIDAGIPRS